MQDAGEAAAAKTPAAKKQAVGGPEAKTPAGGLATPGAHPTPPSAGW